MLDLPKELRDRAARTGFEAYWQQRDWDTQPEVIRDKARRMVDAVAEVLAEHQGEADKAFTDLCHEFNDAQDELVLLRAIVAELRPDAVAEMESPEAEAHSHGFTAGRDSAEAELTELRADRDSERRWADHYHREAQEMRVRAERAEADLAQARGVVEAAKVLVERFDDDRCETDQETSHLLSVLFDRLARSVSPDPTSGHGAFASWHEFYLNLMHDIAGEYVPDPDKRDRLVNDLMSAFAENEPRFRPVSSDQEAES